MSYTEKELRQAVKDSYSYSQVLLNLGKSKSGSSIKVIRNKINSKSIDVSHFKKTRNYEVSTNKKHWKDILIHDELKQCRRTGNRLTLALKESGRKYKCEGCDNDGVWQNELLKLEVDHIDGNWLNNLPDNLRFLCPNCHSQTDNFYRGPSTYYCDCGKPRHIKAKRCRKCANNINNKKTAIKRRKVKNRPNKKTLHKLVDDIGYCATGRKYGVSDNCIRNWLK